VIVKNRVIRSAVLGLVFGSAAVVGLAAPASADVVSDVSDAAQDVPVQEVVSLLVDAGKNTGGGPETGHGGGGGTGGGGICHPGNGSPTCQH
jgi:hypothetical protein